MWVRAYLFYGVLICGILAYANLRGWTIWHSLASGSWGPAGRSQYHK